MGGHQEVDEKEITQEDMNQLTVLHVTGTYPPVKGGAPYFVHNLAKHLTEREVSSPVVTCAVGGPAPDVEHSLYRIPAKRAGGFPVSSRFPWNLKRIVRKERPDVIHGNYPLPFFPEAAALIAEFYDIPFVLTGHGAFEMNLKSLIGLFGSFYNRTFLQASLSLAERIHVSNVMIRDHIPTYRNHKSNIDVIPMGVDTEWYDPEACGFPAPFSTDDSRPIVLFAGSFRRYKQIPLLVEAVDILDSEVRLVLIGDGPELDAVTEEIDRRSLWDAVELLGHVSDEKLRAAYYHSDAFVLPSSSIEESLGLVALEAMAMGLPTIVTDAAGIGQVLLNESAGRVVAAGSAEAIAREVERLLKNPEKYSEQKAAGKSLIAEKFSWSNIIEEYLDMYREVSNRPMEGKSPSTSG